MNQSTDTVHAGLQDIVAAESSICFIDGQTGRLLCRGYDVTELAEKSSFEEVAYLLWYGRLPGKLEFEAFLDSFTGSKELPVENDAAYIPQIGDADGDVAHIGVLARTLGSR